MKPNLHKLVGKSLVVLLFCLFLHSSSRAQALLFGEKVKWEVGFNFGPSFFMGDLGGNSGKGTNNLKDINFEFTKFMKGAFVTMYPKNWIGIRLAGDYTYLEGDDAIINTTGIDELWRKQRNLDFKTTILEGYLAIELFPTMLFSRNSEYEPRLRPYVMGGVGVFHFNPQGSLTDAAGNKTWYYLHPLRLEGQGMPEYPASKPYKLTQMNIPFGGGLKFFMSDRINVSLEFLYRKTFTDYIDDVSQRYIDVNYYNKYLTPQEANLAYRLSDKAKGIIWPGMTRYPAGTQRGDLKDYDTYFSLVMKAGIRLGPIYESAFAKRAARQTRCPSVY
ncbi:MAG TPA: hypothetical protein PLT49_03420 [Ferruginibacter sp.]|nr:hypothetical protein [Ferruginibacter sp.]HMX79244.1 hypothetical protein [Ferruginibacter sp.]HNA01023.1 hypothetical protein [Ferruginibacter sp.]HNA15538.1 hypothetical protein [Ferruginibacter sp.]HNF02089.1 hypothetical protein [Ferruginibacter sp.]